MHRSRSARKSCFPAHTVTLRGSTSWTSGLPQDRRDLVDGVELSSGDCHHQVVGGVVAQGQATAVEPVEGDDRRQGKPLVAVDKGMVTGYRVEQGRGLGIEVGVGILPEDGGLRSSHGRFEQAIVTHRVVVTKRSLGDEQQLRERKVDHSPSRLSASAYRGSSSSSTWPSNSDLLWFSMYSRMACRATSCIERCSSSERRRSASVSSSASLSVIAIRIWYHS